MSDPRISGPSGEQPPALPPAAGSSPAYPGFPQTPPAHTAPPQYAAPQQYATPQQYGAPQSYGAAPARPTSGLAVAALVCGIAGVVLFWALLPMLASIAAVITGHMALGQIRRTPGLGGRGMAIAGLVMGYLMIGVLVFTIVSTLIGLVVFGAFTLPFVFAS